MCFKKLSKSGEPRLENGNYDFMESPYVSSSNVCEEIPHGSRHKSTVKELLKLLIQEIKSASENRDRILNRLISTVDLNHTKGYTTPGNDKQYDYVEYDDVARAILQFKARLFDEQQLVNSSVKEESLNIEFVRSLIKSHDESLNAIISKLPDFNVELGTRFDASIMEDVDGYCDDMKCVSAIMEPGKICGNKVIRKVKVKLGAMEE